MDIFLALVHHPVLNRRGQVVTTALTNVDVHDLARSARTYGVSRVFVVTPVTLQQRMVEEIVGHWTAGDAAGHDRRASAMHRVVPVPSIEAALADITGRTGCAPEVAVTGAQMSANVTYESMRTRLLEPESSSKARAPLLVLFGTGWGLAPAVVEAAVWRLPPVAKSADRPDGDGPYNHLSVRAAVAIILDRLLGDR